MKKCFLCSNILKGIGVYDIKYLNERIFLCGACMRNLFKDIKNIKKYKEIKS